MSLSVILALALAPAPGWVELDRGNFHALTATPALAVVPAWAASRELSVTPVEGGVLLRARWTLRSLSRGAWFSGHVLGNMPGMRVESLRWDGQPAAAGVGPGGVTVAGRVSGSATIEVVAFVPGDPARAALQLRMMPATRGEVEATAPAGQVARLQLAGEGAAPLLVARSTVAPTQRRRGARGAAGGPAGSVGASGSAAAGGPASGSAATGGPAGSVGTPGSGGAGSVGPGARFVTAAAELDLSYGAAPAAPGDAAAVVVARAGLGLTVGDAELRGRGRLVWELRRGAVSAVDFTASGVGADLEVKGPNVRTVQRSGEQVHVELQAPVSGRLELELSWSAAIGKAAESSVTLPQIRFESVFRAEASLQLARDGEVEAVPELQGWTPSSAAALPGWGQGLVEGAPTAAFTASAAASGTLALLRFVPIEGPPVVVDVAAYTIATSREGRALMRAHYEVRNERAASLQIRPPPGYTILGVRVAGATAMIARDRDGAWRVPLQRSVDTVSGLLSFPVEVALIGEAVPWARRERRALPLPRLDAPIAVTRATVHLPPGYRSRQRPGDGEVVGAFTRGEGIHYGLGVGEVGAAEADALFQNAVKGWLGNDFAEAQSNLDKLRAMGAKNENIERLQGNLDLISGGKGKQDEGANRRIREQARARAVSDQVAQAELELKAEQSRQSGDYEAAESQYRAALEVGDRLAKLEQRESVEQSTRNDDLRRQLESTAQEKKVAKEIQVVGKGRRWLKRKAGKFSFSAKPTSSGADFEMDGKGEGGGDGENAANAGGEYGDLAGHVATGDDDAGHGGAAKNQPDEGERPVDKSAPVDSKTTEVTVDKSAPVDSKATEVTPPYAVDELRPVVVEQEKNLEAAKPPPDGAPVGRTTRDFTAIVDVSPTVSRDASDIQLALPAETVQSLPGVAVRGGLLARARRSIQSRRAARDERRRPQASPGMVATEPPQQSAGTGATEPPQKSAEEADAAPAAGLPAPVVTASALSVVVPAVGVAVLYERLLLPAGAAHALDVSAREPLISRD